MKFFLFSSCFFHYICINNYAVIAAPIYERKYKQMDNTTTLPIKLTPGERRKLERVTTAYRTKKTVSKACTVSIDTLKRAIAGMPVKPENADKIRTFLNSL